MKLSIIVPVYNMTAGGKLEYCLNSLLAQSMEDYEIIAVDDKSTDNSLSVLRVYEKKYGPKMKVIASPENRRQGGAKNLGLEAAGGEWIGFVDSDDWISPDMYAKLLKKAQETGADVVGCDYLQTDALGKEDGIPVPNNAKEQTGILDAEKYKKLIMMPGSMVIKIYRRELFLSMISASRRKCFMRIMRLVHCLCFMQSILSGWKRIYIFIINIQAPPCIP